MTDYTRMIDRLLPKPGGESAVRHRTAVVDAVNLDGTVDLQLGGGVVPSVSVLDGAIAGAGDVVQVAAWAGDLLVLGAARASNSGGPRGRLGYAQITAPQAGIGATVADIAGLSATVAVGANRLIRVTVRAGAGTPTVAGDRFQGLIREGASQLTRQLRRFTQTNAEDGFHVEWVGTPTSGSHTYKASAQRAAGTGTLTWEAAAGDVSFILVEDIGPA